MMKFSLVLLCCALIATSSLFDLAASADGDAPEPLKETSVFLTKANIVEHLGSGDPWFIKFFSPHCHVCTMIKPIWQEFADKYTKFAEQESPDPRFQIAEVDCNAERDIAKLFGIDKYPMFFIVKDGKMMEYLGNFRDVVKFEEYVKDGWRIEWEVTSKDMPDLTNGAKSTHRRKKYEKNVHAPDVLIWLVGLSSLCILAYFSSKLFPRSSAGTKQK